MVDRREDDATACGARGRAHLKLFLLALDLVDSVGIVQGLEDAFCKSALS